MPTKIRITKEDLLKSKILNPGWYLAKVQQTTAKAASTDQSTYWTIEMKVLGGPNQKDGSSPVGVTLYRVYSEKATGMAAPFFKAFGVQFTDDNDLDFDAANGREIKVNVQNALNNKGRMSNVVEDFQPA